MNRFRSADSRLPILTFHTLDDGGDAIAFSPRVFQYGLARLQSAGYRTVTLVEALECLTKGRPFPEHALAITFDDGFATVYRQAFPALQRYGMSATVFLLSGSGRDWAAGTRLPDWEGRIMLSWGEIREMQRHGIAFGAHTLTHPDLTRLPPEQAEAEIRDSQALIEDALGAAVTTFAYPFGRYDRRTRDIVSQHFACVCSDRLGLVSRQSDPYALERVDAYYLRTERLFGWMLSPWFPWYVRARSVPRRIRRAIYWRPE